MTASWPRLTSLSFLALLAALSAACTSNGTSTPPLGILTLPSNARLTTDRFSGNLVVGARANHSFTVVTGGQPINVSLTAAGPPATVAMGLGVGTLSTDGAVCTVFPTTSVVAAAALKPQIAGTIDAGTYCLTVFDAGNQTGPVDYAVIVLHY